MPVQDQPQPYLKLCQVLNQGEPDAEGRPTKIFYQEDANGNVLVNNPVYPLTLECEVINFVSEDEFKVRGKSTAFESEVVTLNVAPAAGTSIRQAVFQALQLKYPTLVV